jgi:hypothetical protein
LTLSESAPSLSLNPCKSPDCPAESDPFSISAFELRRGLLVRSTFRREALAVENAFRDLVAFFFAAVRFLGAAFFTARFFALDCLLEVRLDFFAFSPFFLVAILAV